MKADAHVITTNGDLNRFGECVMGRGVAKEAKEGLHRVEPFPILLSSLLGTLIKERGNHVHYLGWWIGAGWWNSYRIINFPVKHHWREPADLDLIVRSADELVTLVDKLALRSVAMVRPGCGNGQLDWSDVEPLLAHLDDRFIVCERSH